MSDANSNIVRPRHRLASTVVSAATLVVSLVPCGWLVLMSLPGAREAFSEAPDRFALHPIAFWITLLAAVLVSVSLLALLIAFSIGTLLGRTSNDRPLFTTLIVVVGYVGLVSVLGRIPGLTTLFRATFSASNVGWYFFIATGLPIWGPLLLWRYGTARIGGYR